MFKKLKKQNGEAFAQTIRNHHNGLLEIPNLDEIVRYAGRDAQPLLPYLMRYLAKNDNTSAAESAGDPFELLNQAGYDAFHADNLEKQNSIKRYFAKGELLCTFNDRARHHNYHVIHAVRKDAEIIKREQFRGREERQDEYGTSVISIQIAKSGKFISIKNRYNHTVANCDNTFDSNPDNIIDGLSGALKKHFNVDFSVSHNRLPEFFVRVDNRIFKYHQEMDDIYYGHNAWAKQGEIYTVDRAAGDAMFDSYLFDNKTKTFRNIDPDSRDSFPQDFNNIYGGNRKLGIEGGSLVLDGKILIGAKESQIKTLYLPGLEKLGINSLKNARGVESFDVPDLKEMGPFNLNSAVNLTTFKAPVLLHMHHYCLTGADKLRTFYAPLLTQTGEGCLMNTHNLQEFNCPSLKSMGSYTLGRSQSLRVFRAPSLTTMGERCLAWTTEFDVFDAPSLKHMGKYALDRAKGLVWYKAQFRTKIVAPIKTILPAFGFK